MTPDQTPRSAHEAALDLSIVLPAHNEIRLLAATLTTLSKGLSDRPHSYEIIVVENGSSDGTLRLARLLAVQLPNVRVLTLPTGNYGAALHAGFDAARGDVVVNFDTDYYDLSFLDTALQLIEEGRELVLASKRAVGAQDRRPLQRRVLTAGFTTAMRTILELDVTDAHGMKAMRRSTISDVVSRCEMSGSLFDVEMVVRATRAGHKIAEIPAVVVEIRPPRTPLLRRSIETVVGLIRLRLVLGRSDDARKRRVS